MKDTYAALPQGFQGSDADFKSHFGWLVAGQLVFAFVFTLIFASEFASGGAGAGIKLGMVAFLGIGTHLIALVEMASVAAIYKAGAAEAFS